MTRTLRSSTVLIGAVLAAALLSPQAGARTAASAASPGPVPALARAGSTPALIEAAVARGDIDRGTADRYLAAALTNPSRLPAAYRSGVP